MPQRSDLARAAMKDAVAKLLLQEPLAKITVRQIVSTAGVARSTFYRNFEDKDDFLAWLQADLVEETGSRLQGTEGVDFTAFYRYARANRDFLKAFMVDGRWPDFIAALYAQATAHFKQLVACKQYKIPDNLLVAYLLGGHIKMFETWLRSDDAATPEQMNSYHQMLGNQVWEQLR